MAFKEVGHNSGIFFSGDGPSMTGTWQNPKTGHKFTVRDCFLQDGQLCVQTTDGQILDYNTIQQYVQCKDEHGNYVNIPRQDIKLGKPKKEHIPKEVKEMIEPAKNEDLLLPEDKMFLNTETTYEEVVDVTPIHETPKVTIEDPDKLMIKKVLGKHPIPSIDITSVWKNIPAKQIDTLVNLLGVEENSIVDYYIDRIREEITFEDVLVSVLSCIKSEISKVLNPPEKPAQSSPNARSTTRKTNRSTKK